MGEPLVLCQVSAAVVVVLGCQAGLSRKPWGLPAAAIYVVLAFWYFGNVFQSGFARLSIQFGEDRLNWAFLQILLFAVTFRIFVPLIYRLLAPRGVVARYDPDRPLGPHEARLLGSLSIVWAALTLLALWRLGGDIPSLLLPPLSQDPQYMWSRSAVGSGLEFLTSVAEYSHLAVGGLLGAVAVLAARPRTRRISLALFAATLSPYLFQHARHRALVVIAPGLIALAVVKNWSIRLRLCVCLSLAVTVSSWFVFMTDARTGKRAWGDFNSESSVGENREPAGKTIVGLEMFDELCYIGELRDAGRYNPGFCGEYFQELVAFIPRTLWPGKPLIGVDYAIARGFYDPRQANLVSVIIARGLVGQGVANCGNHLGPVVSAMLTAIWAGILGRLWAQRGDPARLGLCMIGLALTINMGRGISFLAIFPLVFSYIGVKCNETWSGRAAARCR